MAEDATTVAPHIYKVIFEDEHVRVLEVAMQPGERSELHSHPAYCVYVVKGGKVRFTTPSGESDELELPAGVAMWREAEEHATENVGDADVRAVFFEPKSG